MNNVNGSNHGPLNLNARQRATILHKAGLGAGWVLLSVSDMFELKKNMDGAQKENERLNKQTARLVARGLVHAAVAEKALSSARTFCDLVAKADNTDVSATFRIDALKEVSNLDEALSVLPTPKIEAKPEAEEGKPNG